MREMTDEEIANRAAKIAGWLDHLEGMYVDQLSRSSETASTSGFDPSPTTKPCEHRSAWMRGNLCLACDNTGWRRLTRQEREEGMGVDPYAADLQAGMTVVRAESSSSARSRRLRRLDAVIASLRQDERIRSGQIAAQTSESRRFATVSRKHRTLDKIIVAIEWLRLHRPELYEEIRSERALRILAIVVPGRIDQPPEVFG